MSIHTTVRSPGAIALGALFAIGTGYVLFEDVLRQGAIITTDHVMTGLVLIGTIAAGHFFWPSVAARRLAPALGLGLLFAAGTFICVTGSAGRGAEVAQRRAAEANQVNGSRKDVESDLEKAKAERDRLAARFAAECASGKGPKCTGLKSTIEYADSHIAILRVRLDAMKPAQVANGGLKHAAQVFALLPGFAAAQRIEVALVLLWPFAKALMLEVATIVFLGLGLGHGVRPPATLASVSGHGFRPETDADTVLAALARVQRPVTNDELAALMGVTKSEASKRVKSCDGAVVKQREGRQVAISLRKGLAQRLLN